MSNKRKPKFHKGQVVKGPIGYFQIMEIIPTWDRDAPARDTKPDRFLYREVFAEHAEAELRPLTKREAGR